MSTRAAVKLIQSHRRLHSSDMRVQLILKILIKLFTSTPFPFFFPLFVLFPLIFKAAPQDKFLGPNKYQHVDEDDDETKQEDRQYDDAPDNDQNKTTSLDSEQVLNKLWKPGASLSRFPFCIGF
mmetsp:Transcript_9085/g.27318  ORF Transcript_9085/g.27318 Transcript_9085/m.27318 type:complete len:124 (-) Transcript_9085:1178-1549(-)